MTRLLAIAALLTFLILTNCTQKKPKDDVSYLNPKYAKGFRIKVWENYREIEITEPYPDAPASIRYLLVPKDSEIPSHDADVQVVRTPVDKIVCTSTSHVALLDHLESTGKLVGFPSTDLISSANARLRIDSGLVTDLGIDKEMNLELLVSLQPDLVMGYSVSGDMMRLDKIKKFGIPVVINGEYLEEHPLGRAEWIKFMGMFLDQESMADSIFTRIEQEYLRSQSLVDNIKTKPTVISGILYGDAWFLPGGQNYGAEIFRDAGYHYLWDNDSTSGFLKLSFESVYAKAENADYWIGVGSFQTKQEMQNAEKRYSLFKAFSNSQVYTYDARKGAKGGSEYFELGYSRPDLILKDLIKIAHPELLPDYELYFHKRLE